MFSSQTRWATVSVHKEDECSKMPLQTLEYIIDTRGQSKHRGEACGNTKLQ